MLVFFFFNDTATTEIYTLSLHDALPIFYGGLVRRKNVLSTIMHSFFILALISVQWVLWGYSRSEEHTSELQSRQYLVCRLLLEKKKKQQLHYSLTKITITKREHA